jgi:hypothetical protein
MIKPVEPNQYFGDIIKSDGSIYTTVVFYSLLKVYILMRIKI